MKLSDLDRFWEVRPDVFYLCEFMYGKRRIRTDIPVYSSLQGLDFFRYDNEYYRPILRYCKKLRALDLGHNAIDDLSLIGEMKDLEILILADNYITDASPLANLKNLTYLELFLNRDLEDFSFLYELPKLRELNLCYCAGLTDLGFLENMPDFTFGVFKFTGVSQEQGDYWSERYPEAKIVISDKDHESSGSGWRNTLRNDYIRAAFKYWTRIVRYDAYDDVDFNFEGRIRHISYYAKHKQ